MRFIEKKCVKKFRHDDEWSANNAIKTAYLKYGKNAPTLRSYQCKVCNGWHLTSKASRQN